MDGINKDSMKLKVLPIWDMWTTKAPPHTSWDQMMQNKDGPENIL